MLPVASYFRYDLVPARLEKELREKFPHALILTAGQFVRMPHGSDHQVPAGMIAIVVDDDRRDSNGRTERERINEFKRTAIGYETRSARPA